MELEQGGIHLFGIQGTLLAVAFVALVALWGWKLLKHRDMLVKFNGLLLLAASVWIAMAILGVR